jgi:hypothetical protein
VKKKGGRAKTSANVEKKAPRKKTVKAPAKDHAAVAVALAAKSKRQAKAKARV